MAELAALLIYVAVAGAAFIVCRWDDAMAVSRPLGKRLAKTANALIVLILVGAFVAASVWTYRRIDRLRNEVSLLSAELQLRNRGMPITGKRGLWLGDSIGEGALPNYVAQHIGATIINGSIGGTVLSRHTDKDFDKLSGSTLAAALRSRVWTEQQAAVAMLPDQQPAIRRLQSVDLTTIEFVVLAYGTNDFARSIPLGSADDNTRETWRGAINETARILLTAKPTVRLFYLAPIWRSRMGGEPMSEDADTAQNASGVYLVQYVDAMIQQGQLNHVPVWDGFRLGRIGKHNAGALLEDGVHPTKWVGEAFLAPTIASFLLAHY